MGTMMKSMKFTKAEKKRGHGNMEVAMSTPEYPWGLSLNLDDAALKKLGIDELPEAGDTCEIMAHAKVTRVSQSTEDGKNGGHRNVEIQITHLSLITPEDDKKLWDQAKKQRREE